jgi:hypothetical protein
VACVMPRLVYVAIVSDGWSRVTGMAVEKCVEKKIAETERRRVKRRSITGLQTRA